MAVFTLAALKAELQQDPSAIGYNSNNDLANQNWPALRAKINKVQSGPAPAQILVKRRDIAPSEILEVLDNRDLAFPATNVIAAANQLLAASMFESITQLATVRLMNDDGSDTRMLANIKRLLNNGQGSITRLAAVASRDGSRAEQLWGTDFQVSEQQVADAILTA